MTSRLRELAQRMQDPKESKKAIYDLYAFEPTKGDLPELYWALRQDYPDDKVDWGKTRCLLFTKLEQVWDATSVQFLEDLWPLLPGNPGIREGALDTLAGMLTSSALRALCKILVRDRPRLYQSEAMFLRTVAGKPANAGVMFPELLDLLGDKVYRRGIYAVAAAALDAGAVEAKALKPISPRLLRDFREARCMFADKKRVAMYTDSAQYMAAIVTVMRVFADMPEMRKALLAGIGHDNAQVAFAAFRASRKLGWDTAPETLERFAADLSTRLDLLEELEKSDQGGLFPRQWRTQESFAEGDMVRWVSRDNCFMPPPRSLKLIETRTVNVLGKPGRIYIYKFKNAWSGREWVIGISGPQPMDPNEMVASGAGTFTAYSSLRDRDMNEHMLLFRDAVAERSRGAKRRRRK